MLKLLIDIMSRNQNYGHECGEDCEVTCDRCGNATCEYDIVTVKSDEYDGELSYYWSVREVELNKGIYETT